MPARGKCCEQWLGAHTELTPPLPPSPAPSWPPIRNRPRTLDGGVQLALLLVLQCQLLALLLDVFLQRLELPTHDAVLALEPQARLALAGEALLVLLLELLNLAVGVLLQLPLGLCACARACVGEQR